MLLTSRDCGGRGGGGGTEAGGGGAEAAGPWSGRKLLNLEGLPETQGFLCCSDEITAASSELFGHNILNDTKDISNA